MHQLLLLTITLCLTSAESKLLREKKQEFASRELRYDNAEPTSSSKPSQQQQQHTVTYAIKNVTLWHERLLDRVNTSSQRHYRYDQECNLKISQAPGTISYRFDVNVESRKIKPCRWTIKSPSANQHVYVRFIHVESYTDRPERYDDAELLPLKIFDGYTVDEDKLLFRFGDATLNNALSSGRDLTIDVKERYFATVDYHSMSLLFGFVERDKVLDLLRLAS